MTNNFYLMTCTGITILRRGLLLPSQFSLNNKIKTVFIKLLKNKLNYILCHVKMISQYAV